VKVFNIFFGYCTDKSSLILKFC